MMIGLAILFSFSTFANVPSFLLKYGEVGFAVTLNGKMFISCGPNPDPQRYYYNVHELKVGQEYQAKVGQDTFMIDQSTRTQVRLNRGDYVAFKCSKLR